MRYANLNGERVSITEPGDAGYQPAGQNWAKLTLAGDLRLQVSEKRALSLYGMRRFPVTLYAEEWEMVLRHADAIRGFIHNHPELSRK